MLERTVAAAQRRIDVLRRHRIPIELDLMDGRFVSTRSFGPDGIVSLKVPPRTTAHLMVDEPTPWINACVAIGIRRFVLHVESRGVSPNAVRNVMDSFEVTIAVNPKTSPRRLGPYAPFVKGFQVMTVTPGRQGAPFIRSRLSAVRTLKRRYPRHHLAVDGGMSGSTIPLAAAADADRIIVGSALKHSHDITKRYRLLVRAAR